MHKKRFVVFWDEGYGDPPKAEVHTLNWFSGHMDYNHKDILRLDSLEYGQVYSIPNRPACCQLIFRVTDEIKV